MIAIEEDMLFPARLAALRCHAIVIAVRSLSRGFEIRRQFPAEAVGLPRPRSVKDSSVPRALVMTIIRRREVSAPHVGASRQNAGSRLHAQLQHESIVRAPDHRFHCLGARGWIHEQSMTGEDRVRPYVS